MIVFNNPNDYWMNIYDPYKGQTGGDEQGDGSVFAHIVYGCASYAVVGTIFLLTMLLLSCCASGRGVAVVQQHTERCWRTDTVRERDSVHTERETIVRELDSAAMARYGVRLQQAERAWLVETSELRLRLQQMERASAVRDTVHDSIPVPVRVEVEVEKEKGLTGWQRFRMSIGDVVMLCLAALPLLWFFRRR